MKNILLLCCSALFVFGCNDATVTQEKPNIIFILTDDQRWDALGYAGNDLAFTPEMDKLAQEGVFFKNTIATTPICSASRASIISGLYERTHNYSFTTGSIKEEYMQNAYPRILKKSGYHTALFGKFGVKYDHLDSLYNEYENYDLLYNLHDRKSYYYKTLGKDTVHLTRYTGQKALDFLDKASQNKPFCLQLSFSAPHASDNTEEQYFWDQSSNHVLENTTVPLANISEDEYYNRLPQLVKDGFNRLRWYWRYDTPEKYQHSVKGYYRMIAGIDYEISKIRKKLEEKGLADNTVIILMGDNGYFLGERQIAGKWLMYENSIKVPLIVYDPRVNNHRDIDAMALNIDVPSTILDLAGLKMPASWHGKSLLPYVNSEKPTSERDTILIEHLWDTKNIPPSEGLRTKDWKYFRYIEDKSVEELYNIKDDPNEINNLINEEKYADVLYNLRNKCEELISKYKDPHGGVPSNLSINLEGNPKFEWMVPEAIKEQSAYQILLATSQEKLDKNIGDIFNSSKIESSEMRNIELGVPKLIPNTDYYWKVRIWDEINRTGSYTESQKFHYK